MDAAAWGFVGVVVGGLLTGIVSIAAEWLRGKHESNLDSAKRTDDRRLAREAFQRENLLAIQERLAEWMRAETKLNIHDRATVEASGTITLAPRGLSDEIFETQRHLVYLVERGRLTHSEPRSRV
jgi:hypothetical protein